MPTVRPPPIAHPSITDASVIEVLARLDRAKTVAHMGAPAIHLQNAMRYTESLLELVETRFPSLWDEVNRCPRTNFEDDPTSL